MKTYRFRYTLPHGYRGEVSFQAASFAQAFGKLSEFAKNVEESTGRQFEPVSIAIEAP